MCEQGICKYGMHVPVDPMVRITELQAPQLLGRSVYLFGASLSCPVVVVKLCRYTSLT